MMLSELVKIQTGYYAKPDKFGDVLCIQVKNFDAELKFVHPGQPEIVNGNNLDNHILAEGDVLFAAKGEKNFAVVYSGNMGRAVASSTFFVLKQNGLVLPEYLAWFINHPTNLKKLKFEAKGSSIPSISIKTLGGLEIQPPDKNKQRLIVAIDSLRKKEKAISSELAEQNDTILNAKLLNIL